MTEEEYGILVYSWMHIAHCMKVKGKPRPSVYLSAFLIGKCSCSQLEAQRDEFLHIGFFDVTAMLVLIVDNCKILKGL